jgi:hypothetical protein
MRRQREVAKGYDYDAIRSVEYVARAQGKRVRCVWRERHLLGL